jgi:hypothetical protein
MVRVPQIAVFFLLSSIVPTAFTDINGLTPRTAKQSILRDAYILSLSTAPLLLKAAEAQAKVRGYKAAQSAFAPKVITNAVPRLAQSVLLNTLPIDNELVGEVQANLESFTQLIDPSNTQIAQVRTCLNGN